MCLESVGLGMVKNGKLLLYESLLSFESSITPRIAGSSVNSSTSTAEQTARRDQNATAVQSETLHGEPDVAGG